MWQSIVKVGLTALIVVAVAEVAKRSTLWAAALASLPLTSLLAFVWLHLETGDAARVAALSSAIGWLVLPSLALFALLPALLRHGLGFWPALGLACAGTVLAYGAMTWLLAQFNIGTA